MVKRILRTYSELYSEREREKERMLVKGREIHKRREMTVDFPSTLLVSRVSLLPLSPRLAQPVLGRPCTSCETGDNRAVVEEKATPSRFDFLSSVFSASFFTHHLFTDDV